VSKVMTMINFFAIRT